MADISKVKLPDNVTYNLKDSGAVRKTGDTMTGTLTLYKEGTTTQNYPTELKFQNKDTTTGKTSTGYIRAYDGDESGANLVISPQGNMFIGSGEAAQNHYNLYTHNIGENFYATADYNMYLQANGQTIANRVGMGIYNDHSIRPVKADASTNNVGSIGTSSFRWGGMYAMKYNGLLTGTGTAGQDKGSGTTNRYVPAKWTFNIGSNTVGEGDLFVIKLPVAGHDYGTYLSLNNGTNYYPIIYNTSTRLTSHFPASSCIIVTFDSAGSAGSIFPLNGGDARTTVSGGAFRVVDFYDSGNSNVTQTATTTNANYEVLFSGTADNTPRNEGARKSNTLLFNPNTGTLTAKVLTPNKTLSDSWINCGKNPNIYINNTNAAPWITGNTKNGRIALCSYVGNDDKLYFNYWTNTTLAGTENKTDKQMTWDASNGTLTTATFVGALSGNATSATSATTSQYLTVSRVAKDSKSLPGANKCIVEEYSGGANYNLPSNAYYHIYSSQGNDTKYGCQLALGMTTEAAYYRVYNNQSWGDWKSIINTNTDVNVKVNNTNPTTGTWYYPVWYTGTSGTGNVNANDGFRYYTSQGTTSAIGIAYLQLGNATASGTAGNKRGFLRLYAEKAGYADIVYTASATGNTTHTFPTTGGTILNTGTTSFTQSLTSGTKIGTIKINGTSTDLYCQTNTNNAVTQTTTTTDATYDILFSVSTSGTATKTEGARKSEKLTFNPSTQTLRVGDNATGDHIINIGGSTVLNGIWGESDGTLRLYGKYYEAIHIYQTSSSGANSYIQSHHNFNMGDHTLSNGTISSMTYTEGVTNTTGYIMHGRDTTQQYSCQWASSKLNFYVGTTNIGNISDRQLKSEIEEVDPRLMEAIAECKIYQYKAFNRDGLISVGIMAQDLVEKCEKRGIRPENYELLTKMNFIQGDDTLYYSVDYNQYATFMINYLQKQIDELKGRI